MKIRTWPIGTAKPATIAGVSRVGGMTCVIALADDGVEDEAFILLSYHEHEEFEIGVRGTLRFVPGGRMGAQWIFERSVT